MSLNRLNNPTTPIQVNRKYLNKYANIPYGLTSEHVFLVMEDWINTLTIYNNISFEKGIRAVNMSMPTTALSSWVGEFFNSNINKYYSALTNNKFVKGHPDVLLTDSHENNRVLHGTEGIEVKATRSREKPTPEWCSDHKFNNWLLVFLYECSRPSDEDHNIPHIPFRFLLAGIAKPNIEDDWGSNVNYKTKLSFYDKVKMNCIYSDFSETRNSY